MHVCTSQLVLPIVFIVHLFNIVFYFIFYYPYGLLSEIKYYYYYYYYYYDLLNINLTSLTIKLNYASQHRGRARVVGLPDDSCTTMKLAKTIHKCRT